jgi:uncharacterized damage-inducible protein DinB
MADTENTGTVAKFYRGWDRYQDLLAATAAPLTEEQLSWRAAAHLRSAGELLAHIVGCRAGWLHYVLHEGGGDLEGISKWDEPGAPPRDTAELVSGLETTWRVIMNGLERWTPVDLDVEFQATDDDGTVHTFSRQWVLWHLLEHDMHHGGEFSYVLGMHGREGMDI